MLDVDDAERAGLPVLLELLDPLVEAAVPLDPPVPDAAVCPASVPPGPVEPALWLPAAEAAVDPELPPELAVGRLPVVAPPLPELDPDGVIDPELLVITPAEPALLAAARLPRELVEAAFAVAVVTATPVVEDFEELEVELDRLVDPDRLLALLA
jgi:hypothetical protein